jgi:hypothetical protein
MKIIYTSNIGSSPAAIDRARGILYINADANRKLTSFQQKFVYWHELGHYYLNTDSEIKADAYAFDHLAGTEFRSLKQCLECITEILDKNNPTLKPRYDALLRRAYEWDAAHGNDNAQLELSKADGKLSEYTNILWGLIKVGNSEKEKAEADYTRSQGETLKIQAASAGQALVNSAKSTETQVIVISLLIAFYIIVNN